MRTTGLLVLLALVAACAGTREVPPEVQAVSDYVEVGELQQTDRIRTYGSDRWSPLTDYYALYEARDGHYLLEFSRYCPEMTDSTRIKPDRRYDYNRMRSGIDTLRGCRIEKMYPLTEAQALELEVLVEPGGGGN